MRIIAVAGGFDPFHEGHLNHLLAAFALHGELIVLVNPDADLVKKKGYCFEPLWFRKSVITAMMKEYRIAGTVEDIIDTDGTCAKTLKKWKPAIFAKGGDRTEQNMPQNELDTCREIGCRIVYGAGDKLNSSSNIRRN